MNNSIWPIDGTLTENTTQGQSGTGSNGNIGVFHIYQSSRTLASLSDSRKRCCSQRVAVKVRNIFLLPFLIKNAVFICPCGTVIFQKEVIYKVTEAHQKVSG